MNVRKVGAFISQLRRNKNYTQGDVASLLNVSHQAVSKWERGESLPDIGLLPNLSNLLSITIDELLNGETANAALEAAEPKDGQPDASRTGQASTDHPATETPDPQRITWAYVNSLAPFMSKDILEAMVDTIEEEMDWEALSGLAPFLSRTSMERLVQQAMDMQTIDGRELVSMAPFLGAELLERLVNRMDPGSMDWHAMLELAPFIDKETMGRLAQPMDDAPDSSTLVGLAPFMDRSALAMLAERLDMRRISPEHLAALAPFVPSEELAKWVSSRMSSM